MVQPFVSVVIPAYNAARHLRGCLEGLLAQDYPAYEVVVVDDASTDETRAVLREFPRVKVVEQPENRGPGAARNRGVGASGGDLIVFLDSDCLIEDATWLGRHVRAHRDLTDTILGGGIIGRGEGLVARADAYCHWLTNIPHGPPSVCSPSSPPRRVRFSRHLVTTNMSLRRADFLRIGAFDTALRTGEDTEFCERALRLGFSLRLEPSITVVHHDRERLGDFLRCFYRVGKDRVPARTRHRSPYHRLMPRGGALESAPVRPAGGAGPDPAACGVVAARQARRPVPAADLAVERSDGRGHGELLDGATATPGFELIARARSPCDAPTSAGRR